MDTHNSEFKRLEAAREADAGLSGTLTGCRGKHLLEDHDGKTGALKGREAKDRAQIAQLQTAITEGLESGVAGDFSMEAIQSELGSR